MKATYGSVVTLNYTLSLDDGEVLGEEEDVEYLHGYYNIMPGLERALEGSEAGEKKAVVLEAADGYGEHDPERLITAPLASVPDGDKLEPGMRITAGTPRGPVDLLVSEVTDENIVFDANHPLAGERLHFDVEVMSIRAAEVHELSQGHPGPQACNTFG